jgi:hypothetical protein
MLYIVDAIVQETESVEIDVDAVTEITSEKIIADLDLEAEGKTLVDFTIRNG